MSNNWKARCINNGNSNWGRDFEISELQEQIDKLMEEVKDKDDEIESLNREIDNLVENIAGFYELDKY